MKQSAQQTPPPLKQETIPSSKPLNQNRDLKGWLSGQKPGLLMTLSLLFLVPSIIGFSTSLIFRNHLDSFSVEETTTQWGKMGSGEVSIDQASSILLKDEVITTFKIQKK